MDSICVYLQIWTQWRCQITSLNVVKWDFENDFPTLCFGHEKLFEWPNNGQQIRTFFKVDLDLHPWTSMIILDLISFALIFCGYLFFKACASRENDDGHVFCCYSKSKVVENSFWFCWATKSAVKTSSSSSSTLSILDSLLSHINCPNCMYTWWST